ncbi:hypothetical protein AB3662_27050 [Sorangium cellulosum]|uniref:hypothetical protein n=1 Tax=Sorangium cellulosum TaxID=56 RepID=UPI003D9A0EC9
MLEDASTSAARGSRPSGVEYSPGDTFPDTDGCNRCSCTEDGDVACTDMECTSE